jgi:diguanylate cyclase (GGDEF)-like protein
MAGVAFAGHDAAKTIHWVAWVALRDGKAELIDLDWANQRGFTYDDTPAGQSAVAVAIRTRQPCVSRDVLRNPLYATPQFAVFRQRAVRNGYASITAFPLINENNVFGALFMAAEEPDAFDDDEVRLLSEMAEDLAFGIARLRLREQHRAAQEIIRSLAYTDCRTGMPNRTRQLELLKGYLDSREFATHPLSLVHFNASQFTEIGNVFGHEVAEQMIENLLKRIPSWLEGDFEIARVGESLISIILPNFEKSAAIAFAKRMLCRMNEPIEVAGVAIDAHVHAGVVTNLQDANDAETLFRYANAALFHGKLIEDRIRIFVGNKNEEHTARLLLMGDLRHAVMRNELRLYCQPKVNLQTREVAGAEVLTRWAHPTLGMVSPAYFIQLAERSGVIIEVTKWLVDMSFHWLHAWNNDGKNETLAINLSAYDLLNSSIVEDIQRSMEKWCIRPDSVEFELTESALIDDPSTALDVLNRIKSMGVKLLIDDFGTGYSSMSYLQRFPFDIIKIDQSFVIPMLNSPDSAAIVHSTIELGHILGRQVVAEGVENQEIWERLREQGCDFAQGYEIGKPIPIEELQQWKADWNARNA